MRNLLILLFFFFSTTSILKAEKIAFCFEEEYGLAFRPFDLIQDEPNLRQLIEKVDPSLFTCSDPLEIAKRLLPIMCDITPKGCGIERATRKNHNALSSQEYYTQVIRQYEAPLCGGRSTFYTKVLREYFNIPAFPLDMGEPGTDLTHVATVVPIKRGDAKYDYYFFDAHNGCYFVDLDGQIMHLKSLFEEKPFVVKYIRFGIKTIVDETFPKPLPTNFMLEKEVNSKLAIYSYSSLENHKALERPWKECAWQETLPLRWLDLDGKGGLIHPLVPKSETLKCFFKMLEDHNIHIFYQPKWKIFLKSLFQ